MRFLVLIAVFLCAPQVFAEKEVEEKQVEEKQMEEKQVAVQREVHKDAVSACTQLVTDYAFYRDRPDPEGVAQLFTEDAQFSLMGSVFSGREAIRDRVAAGVGGPVFRHMISTINIEPAATGDRATGVTYVTVYQGKDDALPQAMSVPMAIGEYHDRFERTAEGWRIAERNFVPVFLSEPEEADPD